jgi:two-component system sensor histidine kinase ChiS
MPDKNHLILYRDFMPQGHILIVSDNGDDIFYLTLLLKKQGFAVDEARTPDIAWEKIEQCMPDVILLTPFFQKKPTASLCQKLHQQANTAHIPLLYLLSSLELKQYQLFKQSMADYLLKPFQAEEVINRLQNYCYLSQLLHKLPALQADETLAAYSFTQNKKIEQMLTQLLIENQSLKKQLNKQSFTDISTAHGDLGQLLLQNQTLEEQLEERNLKVEKLNTMYECFVPREFLDHLGKSSIVEVQPGDQIQKKMSIIFLDIREFTSLSEKMSPQENFSFLNEYLSYISPVVRQHSGFIDKYIGDAIMALFPNDPEDALKAAIGIRQALSQFNIQQRIKDTSDISQGIGQKRKQAFKPITIGIGIHTGNMILGVIGEKGRMQSTVISDAVNLASRLEGLTKIYGATIIISLQALELTHKAQYRSRYIGRIQVKGKKKPVSVYEIFDGDSAPIMALKMKTRNTFVKALENYQHKKIGEAATLFRQVLDINPNDKAAKLYLNRISTLVNLSSEALNAWEPIEVLDHK